MRHCEPVETKIDLLNVLHSHFLEKNVRLINVRLGLSLGESRRGKVRRGQCKARPCTARQGEGMLSNDRLELVI